MLTIEVVKGSFVYRTLKVEFQMGFLLIPLARSHTSDHVIAKWTMTPTTHYMSVH